MRLAAYAGASTALAAGVIIYAFNQRANFYSACVYLSQSNLCLMILTNLILFIVASFMFGLQRVFYGPLRPTEIEQLSEKAWFAVTETCLAMTIFREEVGAWFLVMFVALLAGKVWGWIGEGRVEVLEQQPPANPRLVHLRLSLSLTLSLIYDVWLLRYTINTVIQQARPNMMVMFLFEFAVLTTSSVSTALRYCISLVEARIVKHQTAERLEFRRREVREEREEMLRQRAAAAAAPERAEGDEPAPELPPLPSEDDVDEIDVEVPGWEAKGQWVLTLDLMTDFVKLGIYTTFFFILLKFYGLPIHIMRDLFLTARSFIKRLTAFLRYRKATHDMNERYPDATVEEIQRVDTCIICREEMRPWSVTNPAEPPVPVPPVDGAPQPPQARPRATPTLNERSRPKKLPCGHVLHLGCLKSWLERQQVCPTCRRPVVDNRNSHDQAQLPNQGAQGQVAGRVQLAGAGAPANGQAPQANGNVRMLQLGPLRFAFGQANNNQDFAQRFPGAQQGQQNPAPGGPRLYGLELGFPRHQPPAAQATAAPANGPANSIETQLAQLERQIMQELQRIRLNQSELQILGQLHSQLLRNRTLQGAEIAVPPAGSPAYMPPTAPAPSYVRYPGTATAVPRLQQHAFTPGTLAIPSGSPDLPPGLTIPEGWTLLPLQQLDRVAPSVNSVLSQLASQVAAPPSNGIRVPESEVPATQPIPASTIVPASDVSQNLSQTPTVASVNSHEQSERAVLQAAPTNGNSSISNMEEAEPLLSNRGASQLFGASNSSNHITAPSAALVQPLLPEPSNTTPSVASKPSSSGSSVNGSIVHTPDEDTAKENPKGKARAATVEDANDDV